LTGIFSKILVSHRIRGSIFPRTELMYNHCVTFRKYLFWRCCLELGALGLCFFVFMDNYICFVDVAHSLVWVSRRLRHFWWRCARQFIAYF